MVASPMPSGTGEGKTLWDYRLRPFACEWEKVPDGADEGLFAEGSYFFSPLIF
jgi:hypothetical protein